MIGLLPLCVHHWKNDIAMVIWTAKFVLTSSDIAATRSGLAGKLRALHNLVKRSSLA